MRANIALITGIISDEVRQDPWGTLERVSAIGYRGIELGGDMVARAGGSATALKRRLDDLGLETFSYGTELGEIRDDLDTVIERASALSCRYVVLFWAPCESRASVLALAELFGEAGARLKAHGLQFCYHNHDHEFTRFGGETGLDILFGHTDPDLVKAEIDIAWVQMGGENPASHIRRFSGRCPLIHVKDVYSTEIRGAWTEVGTGVVDLSGSVEAAMAAGADWFVVEQDQPRDLSPMDSIRVSYEHLRQAIEALGHSV